MQNMIPNRKEKGFTLIELVMVIVILGILAAFALPRFADLSGDARESVVRGAQGSVKSAVGITRSAFLAAGGTTQTAVVEGETINMSNGYPVAHSVATGEGSQIGIAEAAQISDDDFDLTKGGTEAGETPSLTVSVDGTECSFTYTEATADEPATVSPLQNCP